MRQWLLASGCALDPLPEEEFKQLPLQILQGGAAESTVFRIAPGLTGYWVWLQVATDAESIRIAELQFELRRSRARRSPTTRMNWDWSLYHVRSGQRLAWFNAQDTVRLHATTSTSSRRKMRRSPGIGCNGGLHSFSCLRATGE